MVWRHVSIGAGVAATAAALTATPTFAQSGVALFGHVDQCVGAKQLPGAERAWGENRGGMHTSYRGSKGQEDSAIT